jgi:hypothetical protein
MTTNTDDDAKVVKGFERFAMSGYEPGKFTDAIYRALSIHCFGFIAHYDRNGFYAARFGGWPQRVETLATMASDTPWPARLLEVALRDVVLKHHLLGAARTAALVEVETKERAELARLREKYGS